jgi:hypothetical protein
MRSAIFVGSLLLLSACAEASFVRPDIPNQSASASVQSSKAQILSAAVKTLVEDGYQVTVVDNASGLISTAPRAVTVTPAQVDCGRFKGPLGSSDPLTFAQSETDVAFNILAGDNRIEVRATIDYHVKIMDAQNNVTCVSRGILDQTVLNEIKARL